jgi:lipopolysaccharide/colanic/teichoic acid biosynthesis glycosyltransferase
MWASRSLRVLAVGMALGIVWLGASFLFFGPRFWTEPLEYQVHLAFSLACAAAVVGYAAKTRGPFEYKVQQAFVALALIFGGYAFILLTGRLFFSRTIFITVLPATLLTALFVVWLRHRYTGTKIAVIKPLIGEAEFNIPAATIVTAPSTDLRSYDLVLISLDERVSAEWARALSHAMLSGCKIRHIGEYFEELRGAVSLEHFELDHLSPGGLGSYHDIKRALDVLMVIYFLPVALPVFLLAAAGVWLTTGSPIFFVQQRTGLGGRPFRMWKLRTMRPEPAGQEPRAAVPGDSRVTPIGRILRRFRIDELPQLWNVMRGDMSLIGPRPEAVEFHNAYTEKHPKFAYRCLVRPGITGWAQVNAPPSANPDEAKLKLIYDLYYVKHLSIGLDMQILIRTFWTIAHGSGVR